MRNNLVILIIIGVFNFSFPQQKTENFPDGTPIGNWFKEHQKLKLENLGKQFLITNFGVKNDSTLIQTQTIQAVIDKVSADGGGVILIPKGVFLSGA